MEKTSSRPKVLTPLLPLTEVIRLLRSHYGNVRSPAPKDPFELLLWEYVAYLTDDARRAAAFEELRSRVGTTPDRIAAASPLVLESICRAGGAIAFKLRAERMRVVAVRVRDRLGGSLDSVLQLPYPDARRVLKAFPAIGPPGADKILLQTGARTVLALDSNALRVVLRLGFGQEQKSYAASYASAQAAASATLPRTLKVVQLASLLLRHHGQELCRRSDPRCPVCPLEKQCRFARSRSDQG